MNLKEYQKAALATLRRFLEEARLKGPKAAYEAITAEAELATRLRGYAAGYRPLAALPDVPHVCLRLPTGGGKTILAAHAITVARDAWIEQDFPLVLWLVPTNTIRLQTAEALKNPRHPYRRVLDAAFEGRVRVFDITDFAQITPHDLRTNLCIVTGTIQTLRQSKTDTYRVYRHHEKLEPHFSSVPAGLPGLERDQGALRFSFANLMHLHRPLVIMDEAHKAVSELSHEVYKRINPTALIEFTATPKGFNNILHSVSARELKDEEMIKMPVVLDEADTWQGAVTSAIHKRAELQDHANQDTAGYIRPIVLFQAQKKSEEVTVDVLRNHLIRNEDIDPDKIAVATGTQRELDGINLFDPDCPIEYVITIEALKEGWDCSFAYVFCSVANIRSATDAEQLLGRVLRMPYATRRTAAALNKSYARLVSKRFAEAAQSLRDKLVNMGFEEREAEANIEAEQPGRADGLFGQPAHRQPTLTIWIDASEDEIRGIGTVLPGKVKVTTGEDGRTCVEFTGIMKPGEEERFLAAAPEYLHGMLQKKLEAFKHKYADALAPAQCGETFVVPRLMAHVQGVLLHADTDILMEYHDWSLTDYPAGLTPSEFDVTETTNGFEIDLDGNRLVIASATTSEHLTIDVDVDDRTHARLVAWLDRQLRDPDISQADRLAWLGDAVTYLNRDRGLPLSRLMRCKFILARKMSEKIRGFRQVERDKVFQHSVFGPDARVEVSFKEGFTFFDGMYADVPKCRKTGFAFRNHFMGRTEVPFFDGTEDGEEAQCAFVIDGLPNLDYWVRNVARHRNSFWLPTPTDKFYPDFVAKLQDGRVLVVEYKGRQHAGAQSTKDTHEKTMVGEQWAQSSGGKAVFITATITRGDPNEVRTQILDALKPGNGGVT
ncbi:MAG: DEAD/DEAH box helicase family protein [Rhodobacteraceae bacterium]|nr:DEAD/DEAH box helicase family protein [Paracoccaceae bacterium]